MKQVAYAMLRSILSALLTVALLAAAFLVFQPRLMAALSPTTATPAASPTPDHVTPPIANTLSYSDALQTYEMVARDAIHASERALDTLKWLVGAGFGLATLVSSAAAYLYKAAREAEAKAKSAETAARAAEKTADSTRAQVRTLISQTDMLSKQYAELMDHYIELKGETLSFDATLSAWERGEIPTHRIQEADQWASFYKWICQGNNIGRHELSEAVLYGTGLTPRVHSAMNWELEKLQKIAEARALDDDEEKLLSHLRDLLRLGPHQGNAHDG